MIACVAVRSPCLLVLLGLQTLRLSIALRPSSGCGTPKSHDVGVASESDGSLRKKHISIADFEDIVRTYWVRSSPRPFQPAPLLIAMHGQTQDAALFGESHKFHMLGKSENLMVALPQGVDDSSSGEEQGTGWNVGSAGNNATCSLAGVGSAYGCYKSCIALKKCGRCNWSTCYNDVLFVKSMIHEIASDNCIDLDRVYAHGESNGAMLVQHLVRELPSTFAGISTWFGTPLVGYLLGSKLQLVTEQLPLSRTAVLSLHGRHDTIIPVDGGVTADGWIYEPLEQSTGVWAALHHCKDKATPVETKWDGGPLNFECAEYRRCSTGRRIMQCIYDGDHGAWPSGTDGDQITLWFLFQFSRSSPLIPRCPPEQEAGVVDATKSCKAKPTMKKIAPSKKPFQAPIAREIPRQKAAEAKSKQAAIADYLNRKPIEKPARPKVPDPTSAPVKIDPEEIAATLP